SVLDQKNDEKRDNRGCGIYDLLPGVRIMKIRTGGAPKYDNEPRQYECPSRSYPSGGFGSYRSEPNTECLFLLTLIHLAHRVWGNFGLCWRGSKTVWSTRDETRFTVSRTRRDGCTMVRLSRSKKGFRLRRKPCRISPDLSLGEPPRSQPLLCTTFLTTT